MLQRWTRLLPGPTLCSTLWGQYRLHRQRGTQAKNNAREREESQPHKTKRWRPFAGPDSSEINLWRVCGWEPAVGRECCSPMAVSRPASLRLQHRGRSLAYLPARWRRDAWHAVGCNSVGYPADAPRSVACDAARDMASHSFHAPGANPARQRETTPHPALCHTRRTLPPAGTTAPRHCCPWVQPAP